MSRKPRLLPSAPAPVPPVGDAAVLPTQEPASEPVRLEPAPDKQPGEPATAMDADSVARMRAQACFAEVRATLAKYNCRIGTRLDAEPVGNDGSKAILSAVWGVFPNL